MSIEQLNPETGNTNKNRLELELNGCEVIVEENEVIAGPGKDNEVAELIRETANAPKVTIRKDGQLLNWSEFKEWRKKVQEDPKFFNDEKYKKIIIALNQNRLSRARIDHIGSFINMLSDKPQAVDWRARYEKIAGGADDQSYMVLSEGLRNKMMDEIDKLAIDIYNSL
ncbi:MAG: hypothetical protein WC719_04610 [Patescibacteria group bacterium]|jgi:hypothetical protein